MIDFSLKDWDDELLSKDTLTELIDNNEKILHSQITEATVKKFIDHLISSDDEKAVSILRAMCIYNGEAVIKNQERITGILLLDPSKLNNIVSQMRLNEDGDVEMPRPAK